MDKDAAIRDIGYIREVVEKANPRIDPHLFHTVHWGLIVLVWYPLATFLWRAGETTWVIALGVGSVALGMLLSTVGEIRLRGRSRIEASNTFIEKQIMLVTFGSIGAGMALSAISHDAGFIHGRSIPALWGLVYANMAFMIGVVYTREWLWSGALIFAGTVAAIFLPEWNGVILGPFMGLGMILPGLAAERRVRRLREEAHGS